MLKRTMRAAVVVICTMALATGVAQAMPESQYRQSVYGQAVSRGFCPIGLICPSERRGVKPAISTPGHLARLPVEGGPPIRIVQVGETLWGIAQYYYGRGNEWEQLCWFPRSKPHGPKNPLLLQVGEAVGFC